MGGIPELLCPCCPPLEPPLGGSPILLWLCCPPPELPPPMGIGMPLLPEEPPDIPPCMPPGIPGVLMGMFKPVPPGISIVPKGGRVDCLKSKHRRQLECRLRKWKDVRYDFDWIRYWGRPHWPLLRKCGGLDRTAPFRSGKRVRRPRLRKEAKLDGVDFSFLRRLVDYSFSSHITVSGDWATPPLTWSLY